MCCPVNHLLSLFLVGVLRPPSFDQPPPARQISTVAWTSCASCCWMCLAPWSTKRTGRRGRRKISLVVRKPWQLDLFSRMEAWVWLLQSVSFMLFVPLSYFVSSESTSAPPLAVLFSHCDLDDDDEDEVDDTLLESGVQVLLFLTPHTHVHTHTHVHMYTPAHTHTHMFVRTHTYTDLHFPCAPGASAGPDRCGSAANGV